MRVVEPDANMDNALRATWLLSLAFLEAKLVPVLSGEIPGRKRA